MSDKDPFLQEPPLGRIQIPRWAWPVIGLVSVLIIMGTVRMLRPQMDERLYARYRKLPTADFLPPGDSCCPGLPEAMQLYNEKKYTAALNAFQTAKPGTWTNETRLFSGICYLELNNMKMAEVTLVPLLSERSIPGRQAGWYTALSRLRRHDRKGCIALINGFDESHPRYAESRQLLQHLEK